MKGKRNYERRAREFAQRKSTKPLIFSGALGVTTGGNNVVDVPGRPGFVWVRLRNQLNELVQAFNETTSPVFDLPVLVEWDQRSPNRYRIIGRDVGMYTVWGSGGTSSYLPAHGASHSFDTYTNWGGGDVVWVYGQQFMPWLVTPSGSAGSLSAYVYPATYYYDQEFRAAGGTGIAGFDTLRPTGSSNARMLLVYIDPDTGNPYLATGTLTEFSNTITGSSEIVPYLPPLIEPTDIPLAGVRLITGTSRLLWTNIYDLRDYFSHASVSGTTGGGGAPTDAQYVTMALNGTLSAERVLTAGADIDIADGGAGGNATVSVSTGTFSRDGHTHTVDRTLLIYDDSTFQVTGTAVSFDDNLDVVVTGSVAFVDAKHPTGTAGYVPQFVSAGDSVEDSIIFANSTGISVSGEITSYSAAGQPRIALDGTDGQWKLITFYTDGKERWQIGSDNSAEAAGNSGSFLQFLRNDNSGAYIDTPLLIRRTTGDVVIENGAVVNENLGIGGEPSYDLHLIGEGGAGVTPIIWLAKTTGLTLRTNLYLANNYSGQDTINDASGTYQPHYLNADPLYFNTASSGTANFSGDIYADKDIYTEAWQSFTGTYNVAGWSSFTTEVAEYKRVGNLVFVNVFLEGTSDSTSTDFTVPYSNGMGTYMTVTAQIRNNGTYAVGLAQMSSASSTVNCYAAIGGGSWTASGTKRVACQFFYETS